MSFKLKLQSASGATLVELMVVLAVLSVLSAIAVISAREIREKAQYAAATTIAKNIATAFEDYFANSETDNFTEWCTYDPNATANCNAFPQIKFAPGSDYSVPYAVAQSVLHWHTSSQVRFLEGYQIYVKHKSWPDGTHIYRAKSVDTFEGVVVSTSNVFRIYRSWGVYKEY